jgi:hypothetical protein
MSRIVFYKEVYFHLDLFLYIFRTKFAIHRIIVF